MASKGSWKLITWSSPPPIGADAAAVGGSGLGATGRSSIVAVSRASRAETPSASRLLLSSVLHSGRSASLAFASRAALSILAWNGAGAADAKDSQSRTAKDQQQLIDPQAPIGTEAKSAESVTAKTEVDSPVQTTAADPDSASDLQKLASTDGGRWTKLPTLPSGSNAYHLIMGPKGKILLLADGNATFTKAVGLDFDGSGFGLGTRSKRYAMLVEDGVVKALHVEDSPGVMEVSGADRILAAL